MNTQQHPKVVVIGAGSLFFGREAIWQMVHSPHLNTGTLALVDTDHERLDALATLAKKVIDYTGVALKLETAYDWKDVLPGADFVVLSFADQTVRFRDIDCAISEKYGIRMCSGDTIGPGGIFRAMRELPVIMTCMDDVKELCPDAWVINYINPTAVHGIAIKRYAPEVKSFALCDSLHMPHIKRQLAAGAGLIGEDDPMPDDIAKDFYVEVAGVNHFTWLLKATYRGEDVMPRIAESLRVLGEAEWQDEEAHAKKKFNYSIMVVLYEIFGIIPLVTAHTKEYVRYWQGLGKTPDVLPPLDIWETDLRYTRHAEMWQQVDDFNSGKLPIDSYMDTFGPDHATDIIESMVAGLEKPFYINTFNGGAVPNMAEDAFLELLCDIDIEGPKPRQVSAMPRGVRGMQELILDTHELTAEAVVTGSHDILRRALMTDPLTNSIADADAIIAELLEAERDILPPHWFE